VSSPFEAAFAFLDCCDQLNGSNAVAEAFTSVVQRFGFDRFIITLLPLPGVVLDNLVQVNAWPNGWYDRYSVQHYFDHDPVGQYALLQTEPFRWCDVPSPLCEKGPSKRLMGEAREFGLVDGYCIPMISRTWRRSVVSLSAQSAVDLSHRERAIIHILAVTAYGCLAAIKGEEFPSERLLSSRERDVMTWIAAGKSAWEVSRILNISERTVKAHLESVRRRLDTVNTTQAVVTCIRLGQIQPF
jgi:LuxR family quorum sensing-dependent transcriptional regulator